MAITIGQKPSPVKIILPILLLAALGAAGYFYWTGSEAVKARSVLSQNLSRSETEKNQLSTELGQVKQQLSEMETKLSEMEKSLEETKKAREQVEGDLKRKSDEVASAQSHYEKRIGELENDVKRYADFSAILAVEMKPIKDAIVSGKVAIGSASVSAKSSASTDSAKSSGAMVKGSSSAPSADLVAGQVLAINRDYGFVIVSFGSDNGADIGRVVQIYRKGDPLGLGRIEKIKNSISAASIISEDLMARVQKGDHVVLL